MIRRIDRSAVGRWWWTTDRLLFSLVVVLIVAGMIVALAAPPEAGRGQFLPSLAHRHAVFVGLALAVVTVTSYLTARSVRRVALAVFLGGLVVMAIVILVSPEIKGARRWFALFGLSFQPSEFVKPSFVVLTAWLLAQWETRPDMPALALSLMSMLLFVGLLILQPDVGQSGLMVCVWGAMVFLSGAPLTWLILMAGVGATAAIVSYAEFPHVSRRIDQFFFSGGSEDYQISMAHKAFVHGGWFGVGPGEGVRKNYLPDAETDFIFAVIGEEYGVVACALVALLYLFITVRVLRAAVRRRDSFDRLALAGLGLLFGLQAALNMGVSVHLIPATGLTLPFISYGGSSMMASAFLMGMVLALGRQTAGSALRESGLYEQADGVRERA